MSISFDWIASIYDASRGLPEDVSEQVTEYILRLVQATPNTKFFEPGIGTGRIALPIVERGYSYTGVDISEKMMDELRRKLQGIPNKLTLLKADATSLPFEDDSFDVVLTVHLLHLIPAWREALAEIRRVLKPSGVFLYCHDRTNFYAFEAFEEQWKAILAHYGLQIAWYGAAREEVIQTLSKQGATLEQIVVAEWQSSRTVGQVLQAYQEKLLSSSWQIPDDIFPKAIQGLKAWALKNYGLEDRVISSRGKFELIGVHNWASK